MSCVEGGVVWGTRYLGDGAGLQVSAWTSSRKRQRRRSLTVWKAETNQADYLGGKSWGRAMSTEAGDSSARTTEENCYLFQHGDSGQRLSGSRGGTATCFSTRFWTAPSRSLRQQDTGSFPDEMKQHTEVCNSQQEDQEWKTGGGGEARSPYITTWLRCGTSQESVMLRWQQVVVEVLLTLMGPKESWMARVGQLDGGSRMVEQLQFTVTLSLV
ncbi:hypothetical protein QTO34_015627 [Cnephaeus nilssonii]|uniref:Uncharacterized protein n=1 Tax=Cnephaeus nilssonii TaxID=3371016 RepID=A0AA40I5G8_CNENI|nr:hypothetical protein QTO34_015627 [Eptesicus nilssonii]